MEVWDILKNQALTLPLPLPFLVNVFCEWPFHEGAMTKQMYSESTQNRTFGCELLEKQA